MLPRTNAPTERTARTLRMPIADLAGEHLVTPCLPNNRIDRTHAEDIHIPVRDR